MSQSEIHGVCPFCKYPITSVEDWFVCPGCKVPHHKECLQLNGRCTSFGCNGRAASYQETVEHDYSFNDLVEEYSRNKLVINIEDLQDEDLPIRNFPVASERRPPLSRGEQNKVFSSALWPLAWAGLVGGALTWLVALSYFDFEYYADYQSFSMVLYEVMAFSAIMGGMLGACLGSVEGVTSKVQSKTISGISVGLVFGVIGAALGAVIGHIIYGGFGTDHLNYLPTQIFFRGIFWGFVGLFVGYGQGIASGGGEKAKNGLIGGMIGGAIGGVLFDLFFLTFYSAALSAFIAIAILGICIGLGIGMVQEFRKEAWLKVAKGATSGKEYVVDKNKITLGSNPKSDIVLVRDPRVAANHAIISLNNTYFLKAISEASGVFVNNKKIRSERLKNGDRITIGAYEMIFFEKNITRR